MPYAIPRPSSLLSWPLTRLAPAARVLALLATVAVPAYGFALATGPATAGGAAAVAACAAVPVLVVNIGAASAWLDLRRAGVFPAGTGGRAWEWAAGRYAAAVAGAAGTVVALAAAAAVATLARVPTRSAAGIVLLGAEAVLLAGVCGFDLWRSGRPDGPSVR